MKMFLVCLFSLFLTSTASAKLISFEIPDEQYQQTLLDFCHSQGWNEGDKPPCEDFFKQRIIGFLTQSIVEHKVREYVVQDVKQVEDAAKAEVNIEALND